MDLSSSRVLVIASVASVQFFSEIVEVKTRELVTLGFLEPYTAFGLDGIYLGPSDMSQTYL
jgi:hypothetical protein